MKILIFSDSHGNSRGMEIAIARNPDVDALIHLGDGTAEFNILAELHPQMQSYHVAGNMEEWSSFGKRPVTEQILELEGIRILISHGHHYDVKESFTRYLGYAAARGVKAALFGHTHTALEYYDPESGITLFNPGSISRPFGGAPGFGTLEIRDGILLFGHGTLI